MALTRDPDERELWDAVRTESVKVLDTLMDNLARKIVKEQAAAQQRGQNK